MQKLCITIKMTWNLLIPKYVTNLLHCKEEVVSSKTKQYYTFLITLTTTVHVHVTKQ